MDAINLLCVLGLLFIGYVVIKALFFPDNYTRSVKSSRPTVVAQNYNTASGLGYNAGNALQWFLSNRNQLSAKGFDVQFQGIGLILHYPNQRIGHDAKEVHVFVSGVTSDRKDVVLHAQDATASNVGIPIILFRNIDAVTVLIRSDTSCSMWLADDFGVSNDDNVWRNYQQLDRHGAVMREYMNDPTCTSWPQWIRDYSSHPKVTMSDYMKWTW